MEDTCPRLKSTVVDNCPERMHAADAEAPRPPRIETAVEFWSGTEVGAAERMHAAEAVVLAMRFFWCSKKKKSKQKQAAGEC